MILSFLLLSWVLCSITGIQLNLYSTDHTLDISYEYVNCLHYYDRDTFGITEKTEYCLGPISSNYLWTDDFLKKHVHFTFDQLRQLNVTANKLLSWSATIDLTEKYQYYIDNQINSLESQEIFFNCSKPWFGPRCQYSFDLNKTDSFRTIVQQTLRKKLEYDSSYNMTNLTCYNQLKCDRGGSGMCLDWREVCDGRMDCIDGGADEAQCFDLERNECNENEYRCHNGQCIPKEFLEDDAPQCIDKSDISDAFFYRHKNQFPYILDYEDHSCRSGQEQFVCGDGQCVADFDACKNKRHLLLIESISVQGNLSDICWMTMICLTKILDQVNGTSCDQFLKLSDIDTYLQTCEEDLIQFPTVPVLSGHIRFLYRVKSIRVLDISLSLIPNYICYDEQLCDFLTPTYRNRTYSCRQIHELNFDWDMKSKSWASVIRLVERYFRKCLVRYNNNSKENYANHSLLHCCKNSSKSISKHRILDGVSDCYLNDDEEAFELSCKVSDALRFECPNENKCYSSSVARDICSPVRLLNFAEIEFRQVCDRHVEMFPLLIDGQNHTDETDCERWPCSNFYTRCDGFWSCSDGSDDENCTQQICHSGQLPCVTPYNYTFICLLANRVNDGHIDCLGAVDELEYCRSANHLDRSYPGFRCLNDTKCIAASDLCNTEHHCPLKDDEGFCGDHRDICNQMKVANLTDVEKAICLTHNVRRIQFSMETSTEYPLLSVSQTIQQSIQLRDIQNLINDEINDSEWLWYCNHGLYVRHWLGESNFSYRCFCPPSYYGDECQYQNQRVRLTVQLRVMNIHTVYEVIVTLINDEDNRQEIISFQQYTSISIARYEDNFNAYLTYGTRPKRNSTKYSIHIDVFNKISLTYLASWYFAIPFSFLPVNRMAILLYVADQSIFSPTNCSLACHHGQCMKYMNKEKFFCRCQIGWSGARCNISVHCNDCSPDSICIGVIHNRAICVCPLHKRGPRCLLTLSHLEGTCLNNGQYLALDVGFACICSKEYHGQFCDQQNSKLEISFRNMEISSFLLIYIFAFDLDDNTQQMVPRIIPQKLTMFQRTVLIYTEIPTRMAFVKIENNYYLAVLQHSKHKNIATSIDSNQRCALISELLNTELLALPEIHRIKYYHTICQTHIDVMCFTDELYMCLCTIERHANCFKLQSSPSKCSQNNYCMNGAECFQNYPTNPSTIMCICPECFFGSRCQFYAKSIGITLDDILRYEIQPNTAIYDQKSIVRWSTTLTMIMFGVGLIGGVLSILAFLTKDARKTGFGIYFLTSSITSLLTMTTFTVKFWFLVLIQTNPSVRYSVLRGECISLEFILKVCLYTENWLSACVAIERSVFTCKGIHFNNMLSKRVARWIIIILPLFIMASFFHELLYRTLFYDIEEQRLRCVLNYSRRIHMYNTFIVLFHSIGPNCINIFSFSFINFHMARIRNDRQTELTYSQHVFQQFMMSKQIFIGPIILLIATVPRLMLSLTSGCTKTSYNGWLYLLGYFVSFIPSITIFFVFVLPSDIYRRRLKNLMKFCRRRNR